jgi:hypothetical protein
MDTTTSHIESTLIELVWAHRDKLVDLAEKSFRRPATSGAYTAGEIENWIDGFILVLLEALQNQKTSYRKFFLERMIRDLVASGIHPQLFFQLAVAWSILVSNEFVLKVPPSMQAETTRWFSSFFAGYLGDTVEVLQNTQLEESHSVG